MEPDLAYYERRVREERELEEQAAGAEARSAHRLLATIYADRVKDLRSGREETKEPRKAFQWR